MVRASPLLAALCVMELRVASRPYNPLAFCSDAFSLRSRHGCAARSMEARLQYSRGVARRTPSLVHDSGDVWEDPLLPSSSFSSSSAKSTGIAYLDVPYEQKDAAKALGAKWDPSAKRWYAPPKRIAKLRRWLKIPAADDEVNESGSDDEEEGGYIEGGSRGGGGDVMGGSYGPLPRVSGRSHTPRGGRGRTQHTPELGDMVYLRVPYAEKNEAKSMGAWWDPARQAWYVRAKERHSFKWPDLPPELECLQGEDRGFGGDDLYVDLVPASCWFTNVRSCVDREDWRRLRRMVLGRADGMCECCGATDDLEVHERWSYTLYVNPPLTHSEETPSSKTTHATTPSHDAHEEPPSASASGASVGVSLRRVQRLERLMALCSACHDVTHFGLAELEGRGYEAFEHLTEVRGWSDLQAQEHLHEAYEIWKEASMYDWELDLSLLTTNGIELIEMPPTSHKRRVVAEEKLRERQ